MTDVCLISRPATTTDETFDEGSGEYTAESTKVYQGKCFLSTQGWQPAQVDEGGQDVTLSSFRLVLPLTAPRAKVRDMVTMTMSLRSPYLKGQVFEVMDTIDTSHAVAQNVLVQRHAQQPPL